MTLTLNGSFQAVTPKSIEGAKSVIVQNPSGNASVYVTQRIEASGLDESDGDDCPGLEIVAGASLSLDASSTFWVKGTAAETANIVFFR